MTRDELTPAQLDVDADDLVAYLDGELPADAATRVEQRLADEPQFRLRLQQLQQAWDFMDDLPHAVASDQFTRTTVEMVVTSASQEMQTLTSRAGTRNWWRLVLSGGCLLSAMVLGFLVVRDIVSAPDRQLAEDLPLIQRFQDYRYVDGMEFLRELDERGLFAKNEDEDVADVPK